jgi:ureidoacrylate peracid hydrolase
MAELSFSPRRTALINVDMQNCFVDGSPISAPGGLRLLERVNELTGRCRAAGMLIIHASHVLRPDLSNAGLLAENPLVAQGIISKGSQSASLHPALDVQSTDTLLEKPRFGAFHGTDLELLLRSRGIDTAVISGIATNVCCETTAREAAVRDFRVIFLSDGTATFGIGDVTAGELQRATCATIGLVFGTVALIDDVLCRLHQVAEQPVS